MLDSPGTLGGAINLVNRKPTKALENEARGTLNFDRDAHQGGYNVFGLLGTRAYNYYVQGSYTRNVQNRWDPAGGLSPTVNEDGGAGDFFATRNGWRNAKAGLTPTSPTNMRSATRGRNGARTPRSTSPTPSSSTGRGIADAPLLDLVLLEHRGIYFLSTTALGDRATLKIRVDRNELNNALRLFDDRTQSTQTLGRALNSYHEDRAYGGSAQLTALIVAREGCSAIQGHLIGRPSRTLADPDAVRQSMMLRPRPVMAGNAASCSANVAAV